MHKDTFEPGGVVRSVGVGGSKVWMSMGVGVGKQCFLRRRLEERFRWREGWCP